MKLKPMQIIEAMTYHKYYTGIDRIVRELRQRGVKINYEQGRKFITEGVEGDMASMIAYLLDLPTPKGFKMPERLEKPVRDIEHRISSKFTGLVWHHAAQKWQANIYIVGKQFYLGLFKEEIDAARAYNEVAIHVGRKLNRIPGEKFDPSSFLKISPKVEQILLHYDNARLHFIEVRV